MANDISCRLFACVSVQPCSYSIFTKPSRISELYLDLFDERPFEKNDFYIFPCDVYHMFVETAGLQTVFSPEKIVGLDPFRRRFLVIPANYMNHWILAVVENPRDLERDPTKPKDSIFSTRVFIFDSFLVYRPPVENWVRKLLLNCLLKLSRKAKVTTQTLSRIPVLYPAVSLLLAIAIGFNTYARPSIAVSISTEQCRLWPISSACTCAANA